MKRKIFLFLLALFLLSAVGAGFAAVSIRNTMTALSRLITLHETDSLRQDVITSVQTVQSDLNSGPGARRNDIAGNLVKLEQDAHACSGCHHAPRITAQIEALQADVSGYKTLLDRFMTTSRRPVSASRLTSETVQTGYSLLKETQAMQFQASSSLSSIAREAMQKARNVWFVLIATIVTTFVIGALVALKLAASVTRPIDQLVTATRALASGDLGYTIELKDKTEFGKLASQFDSMSRGLKNSYAELQQEIAERKQTQAALVKSEGFLNTIFDSIRDPFCIFDRTYRIIRANDAYAEMKKKRLDQLIGTICYKSLHGGTGPCQDCIIEKTFLSADSCAKEKLVETAEGMKSWHEIYTYPILDTWGDISHVVEYTRDITERKRAEAALRESEERFALAARGANDGLWDWDLRNNRIYYSQRWKAMLGFGDADITNHPDEWFGRLHPDDRGDVDAKITAHVDGRAPHFECEYRIMHKDGTFRWMLSRGLAVRRGPGTQATRIAGSQTDITPRKKAEEQLVHDAFHDSLTGLPNRALFMDRLEHLIAKSHRDAGHFFAVLFLDMDRFKVVNDSLGHTVGDELLVAISRKLGDSLRPGDSVARLGGDEFAVLLEGIHGVNDAVDVADRIQKKLSAPLIVAGNELFITVSIGIAVSNREYERPEQVLRDADIAMYQAKARGKGCHEVFETRMHASILERIQLETDLRRAVERREFVLHYQPIIDLNNRCLIGFEALIRWNHPRRGMIYPLEFIPLAEENGLINSIGEWIFRESCRQLALWQKRYVQTPPLKMSINISGKQFSQPGLPDKLQSILKSERLHPDTIALEITESMIMDNLDASTATMLRLREMGFQIHIDDFGTGYSSLSYLHHFPVTALKIDRSFVNKLTSSGENTEIITSIVSLANSLNLKVIAEGVELSHQLSHIRELRCQYGQGYLFSQPMDPVKVDDWIKSANMQPDFSSQQ